MDGTQQDDKGTAGVIPLPLSFRSRLRRQKAIVERDGVCTGCHHIAGSIDADVVDGRWRLPTANLVNLFFVLGRKGIEQIAP